MYAQTSSLDYSTASDYLDVVTNSSGLVIVKILDLQGRIAKTIRETVEQGANKLAVNMSDLKKGTYVLNVFNEEQFIKAVHFMIK